MDRRRGHRRSGSCRRLRGGQHVFFSNPAAHTTTRDLREIHSVVSGEFPHNRRHISRPSGVGDRRRGCRGRLNRSSGRCWSGRWRRRCRRCWSRRGRSRRIRGRRSGRCRGLRTRSWGSGRRRRSGGFGRCRFWSSGLWSLRCWRLRCGGLSCGRCRG